MSENTSLKSQLIGELKDHKEQERLERVKENAKLKEVTIYVDGSPNTKRYITTLDQEGIKYKLLELSKNRNEFDKVVSIINIRQLPIIFVNGNYLVFKRDFSNPQQLINAIKFFANPEFQNPSFEDRMIEQTKTNAYNIHTRLTQLEQKLNPIIGFVTNLQKQLAEEEAAEKKENEQKNK